MKIVFSNIKTKLIKSNITLAENCKKVKEALKKLQYAMSTFYKKKILKKSI